MKYFLIAMGLLVAASAATIAQDSFEHTITYMYPSDSDPREHPVDMINMKVDVSFDAQQGLVRGTVIHTFKTLRQTVDSIVFDAIKIDVKQALLDGKPVRFRNTDSVIIVYCEPALSWDKQGTITFTYEAKPRRGLFFIGWDDTTGTMRRQIWSQGQATDNRHWIPMYDEMNDKMITETVVTFDSAYTVISNGVRKSVRTNGDGSRTWHYAMPRPHSSYLLMIAVGKYAVTYDTSGGGVALEQYWYPDRPQDAGPTYKLSRESMDFLEKEIGMPYQWGIYRQIPAADYVFGAMENTTATVFGDFYLCDARGWLDRSYVGTNTHELTHQWFGDLVTGRSISSLWLQESFATFYPLLFSRQIYGLDEYQWQRRGMQNAALSAGERDRYPIVHPKAGGSRVYPKGAVVLDMMRTAFGEKELRRVILNYLQHHAYENVETNDLYLAFQDTLGLSPRWFFDEWLYRSGEPRFDVSYTVCSREDLKGRTSGTNLVIKQTHVTDALTDYFRMPIVCEAYYTDGTMDSVTAWVDGQTTLVNIPNPNERTIQFVLFDPGSAILKRVTFQKPWEMLMAQVRKAPYMIDRYDALIELAKDTVHAKELGAVLVNVMKDEKHQAMRSEAVNIALGTIGKGLTESKEVVELGLKDVNVDVRKKALNGMPMIPEMYRALVEKMLVDSSYTVIEMAFRRLCRSFPANSSTYLEKTATLKSPHSLVEIARAEIQAGTDSVVGMRVLEELVSNRYEFFTRRNAFSAIVRLGMASQEALVGIVNATTSANWRLADSARDALAKLSSQSRMQEEIRKAAKSMTLDTDQRKKIEEMVR